MSLLPSDASSLLLVASLCALGMRRLRLPACFVIGFALFQMAGAEIVGKRLDPRYEGDSMHTAVRISAFPKMDGQTVILHAQPLADGRIPDRIRLAWFEPPVVPRLGETWELEIRLRRPHGYFNPGGFDYESWLFREKILATGYVVNGKRNRLLWAGDMSAIDRFRSRTVDRVHAAASPGHAAVLSALAVGARHEISRAQWDRFAVTGTSHLMAISGLHVGLAALAGFIAIYPLLALSPGGCNHHVAAIACGVVLACTYATISGLGVPARRAMLMLVLGAMALARRREVAPANVVAATAASVFVADPVASLAPGFCLSFAAVILLLWLARRMTGLRGAPFGAVRRMGVMQVFLMFGLAPLTTLIFQRIALLATPVNLVAVPVFSLLTVPLTLAGVMLGDLWGRGSEALLRLAAWTVAAVDTVLVSVADLSLAGSSIGRLEGTGWLFLVLPLAWVLLPRSWPGRHTAVLGLCALLTWKPGSPPASCFDAWFLDVGQGLAVAIQTRSGITLYDTGLAWRDGGTVAEQTIMPFLESRGVDRIAQLVVSHADLDHSGGAGFLHEHTDVERTVVGEPLPGIATTYCRRGVGWRSGAVHFDILHPERGARFEGNDASCVLRVSVGAHSLLLTGDIEAAAERDLLQSGQPLRADVVLVPHHGSLTSSGTAFVGAVSPFVAVVSAGFRNRWDFPRPSVVEHWEMTGARVLNTATDGAVGVRLCADGGLVEVLTERERRRRFWHAEVH